MQNERVMIFVDGLNLFGLLKEMNRPTTINYDKLARLLAGNRNLLRLYFYAAEYNPIHDLNRYDKQKRFFDTLHRIPYCTIRCGRMAYRNNTFVEKGVDVLLTVDMIRLARLNSYDTAILVSGDCDFVEAVKDVQDMGKTVELVCLGSHSLDLRKVCDKTIALADNMLDRCYNEKKAPVMIAIPNGNPTFCARGNNEAF